MRHWKDLHELGSPNLERGSNTAIGHFANIRQCETSTGKNSRLHRILQDEKKRKQEKKRAPQRAEKQNTERKFFLTAQFFF